MKERLFFKWVLAASVCACAHRTPEPVGAADGTVAAPPMSAESAASSLPLRAASRVHDGGSSLSGTDVSPPLGSGGAAAASESSATSIENGAPGKPSACPEEMVLVEGDYCTQVEHRCVKHWYAPANKKEVCEEFAPEAECVGKRVPKRFCVDRFAWPNLAGERPEVMNNFYQAQVKCAAVGKRLCTESEWTMSCEGPRLLPFPYGFVRDPGKCNGDREWDSPNMNKIARRDPTELARLWQGVRSGQQPECVSEYGVHDLPGNNDEVAASETTAPASRAKYDSVTTGGPWYKGVRNQCRPKIYTHDEGFYYYYLGFRCCAEPDAAPTDPRTPKQITRGWDFSRVERLARFSQEAMREKLEQKAAGRCKCGDDEVLCKTMCGSLLGPNAHDVKLEPRSEGESRGKH